MEHHVVRQLAVYLQNIRKLFNPTSVLLAGLSILALSKSSKILQSRKLQKTLSESHIDETAFPDEAEIRRILERIGIAGPRTTGSEAHNDLIDWLEQELRKLPGLELRSDKYDILRWQTHPGTSLGDTGRLVVSAKEGDEEITISGAVPFSKVVSSPDAPLVYLPGRKPITEENAKGKIILRDFPMHSMPYPLIFLLCHSKTSDFKKDMFGSYKRPGFADLALKDDLLEAGRAGAAGMIIMFHVGREEVESYFEPHQGMHYRIPAVYVGVDEATRLKEYASQGCSATVSVDGEVAPATTRNLLAVLPGQSEERVIFESHTDGNTYVQENGPVALLALAQYFTKQPLSLRTRTIEFAFNSGHLHISKEGSHRHAQQLDREFDREKLTLVIPVEHLGTREIEERVRLDGKPGSTLEYTGRGEMMIWCVGPSPPVVSAVQQAVNRRKLDRVIVAPGISKPDRSRVPTYSSFGGIGTYYHNALLPTTSLISGPWSLWAPRFGSSAVDVSRLRAQTLAIGDVYLALESTSRKDIIGGYAGYRRRRETGANVTTSFTPEEMA
ncbi:uncharacterized protein EKO05_0003834 [Ascochyta rabiei]|uniref:Uncharacterized protein n=1 Tax=Didymella rabiei TaxID=5454 RepID=A0A163C163_DIDRA|nr:uncharacterized protein EKO05_0003834 [Ascochyta rabiei]KZM22144.1 hypothetical protein ST47_g6729 [Ascochyta rabiei]UPX13318.1 hypothetical protein EKO05_0003834 [Ascochyta rabiei]